MLIQCKTENKKISWFLQSFVLFLHLMYRKRTIYFLIFKKYALHVRPQFYETFLESCCKQWRFFRLWFFLPQKMLLRFLWNETILLVLFSSKQLLNSMQKANIPVYAFISQNIYQWVDWYWSLLNRCRAVLGGYYISLFFKMKFFVTF